MLRYFWTATQKDRIRDTCTEYNLPSKVKERIISTVELLDSYYGVGRSMDDDGGCVILIIVLSVKLDAPAPCRLDAPDLDLICYASADCLHQHLQVI